MYWLSIVQGLWQASEYLQDLLIFFGMSLFYLLGSRDVILQVTTRVFVGLESLKEQMRSLAIVSKLSVTLC